VFLYLQNLKKMDNKENQLKVSEIQIAIDNILPNWVKLGVFVKEQGFGINDKSDIYQE